MQQNILVCDNHRSQPIISVCLHKQCKSSRICCFLCTQDHIKHFNQLVPLNEFTSFSSSISDQDIQQFYQSNHSYNALNNLKEQVTALLDLINKEIDKFSNLLLIKDLVGKGFESKKSLDELVALILPYTKVQDDNRIFLDGVKEQQDITKESQNPYKKITHKVQDCISAFGNQVNAQVYSFSLMHKQMDYKIDEKIPSIITKNGSVEGVAYGELEFDLNSDDFRFAFKILNKKSNIWIGIGSINETIKNKYLFSNYRQIGHYQYMIGFHRYVFHHTNSEQNCRTLGFEFGSNDIINISFDASSHILMFNKFQSNQSFKMEIEKLNQLVRPVVWMQDQDSVELLEYQVESSRNLK